MLEIGALTPEFFLPDQNGEFIYCRITEETR